MYSACVVEAPEVREAVLSNEHRRVVVCILDPSEFLTESPWDNQSRLGLQEIYRVT
jgi:hypothetical protein